MKTYISKNIYHKMHKVSFKEVDAFNKMSAQHLLLLAEERAGEHVDYSHIGNPDLKKYNLVWVIASIRAHFKDFPSNYEQINVTTWPGKTRKIFYPRYARIDDINGDTLAQISIVWSLFDYQKRSISFIDAKKIRYYENIKEKEVYPLAKKQVKIEGGKTYKYTPQFHDFDGNGHVNNIKYIDWVYDYLGRDYLSKHRLDTIEIKYLREIRKTKPIDIHIKQEDNSFKVMISKEEEIYVTMNLDFIDIKNQ